MASNQSENIPLGMVIMWAAALSGANRDRQLKLVLSYTAIRSLYIIV